MTYVDDVSVVLNWILVTPTGAATVEIDIIDGNNEKRTITMGITASTEIKFLTPLTNYFFSVYLVTSTGRSPPSNISAMTLSSSMSTKHIDSCLYCKYTCNKPVI